MLELKDIRKNRAIEALKKVGLLLKKMEIGLIKVKMKNI